jgi:hypothetical protein
MECRKDVVSERITDPREDEGGWVMAKYGTKAKSEVKEAMHEYKEGKLKSGKPGKKVTNPKQAIAIGLSKARKEGGKVPSRSKSKSKRG